MASEVHISKCNCGHPSCNQYTLSTQRSGVFSLEDATLYAAAPDLLEACEAFIDRFDHGARADTDYVAGLMRSAIAKATGASNG